MLMKSLIASALIFAGTSAFAAQEKTVIVNGGTAGAQERLVWSSVCVANVELEIAVAAEYKYGEEGEWTAVSLEPSTRIRFMQQFSNDGAPLALTLKFKSPQSTDGADLSYDLSSTVTRFQPRSCDRVENYAFEGADDNTGAIDLVHVD